MSHAPLVYVDTSVFGGVLDVEFAVASKRFFDGVRCGHFDIVVSTVVLEELLDAPHDVRQVYTELAERTQTVQLSEEALGLAREHLAASIVSPKWRADAEHVAMATVSGCVAIVSWNFRHIVHFQKIPLYNGINLIQGYSTLAIHSPEEMLHYEDEDV